MRASKWSGRISIGNNNLPVDFAARWPRLTSCDQSSLTNLSKIASSTVLLLPRPFPLSRIFLFPLFFAVSSQWMRSCHLWTTSADDKDPQWPFEYADEVVSYWLASPLRSSSSYLSTLPFYALPHSLLMLQYAPEEIIAVVFPQFQTML